jgi:hypothetical protein
MGHLIDMTKASKASGKSRTGRYESVGRTSDGVVILKPAVPPTHFTYSQIKRTVEAVRKQARDRARDAEAGHLAEPPQAAFKRK